MTALISIFVSRDIFPLIKAKSLFHQNEKQDTFVSYQVLHLPHHSNKKKLFHIINLLIILGFR